VDCREISVNQPGAVQFAQDRHDAARTVNILLV
jgi:hypothetical protein